MKSQDLSSFLRPLALIVVGFFVLIPLRSLFLTVADQIKFNSCTKQTNAAVKLNCQRDAIRAAVRENNIPQALTMFKSTIDSSEIDCHTLGHEVGRDVYKSLQVRGMVRIGEALPYCGYGFWHGFMSGFTTDIESGQSPKIDLTKVCQRILGKRLDVYGECYHGFGIGFVGDPPKIEYWGNAKMIVEHGIKSCTDLTNDPNYLDSCVSGVFHQVLRDMQDKQFKLSFPAGDGLYNFCNDFGAEYRSPCIAQLGPVLSGILNADVPKIVGIINTKFRWLTKDLRSIFMETIIGGSTNINTDDVTKKNILFCLTLNDTDREDCFGGIFIGIQNKSKGGELTSVKAMYDFCNQDIMNAEQKKICFDYLSNAVATKPMFKEVIGKYCSGNKEPEFCKRVLNN